MTVTAGGPRALTRPRLPTWLARTSAVPTSRTSMLLSVLPDGPLYVHLDLDVTDPAAFRDFGIRRLTARTARKSAERFAHSWLPAGSPR
jgi:hypothetical protein